MAARRNPARRVRLKDGATHANVCVKTLRNWIVSGRLTGYRVGPKLLEVDLDELDQLIRPIPAAGGGDAA